MSLDARTLDALAACLEYPTPDTAARARAAAGGLATDHPLLSAALWNLAVYLERDVAREAEERYTALFDVNPVCTLHVGYHVFGDTYPRGELLAALAAELRRHGIGTNGDLPDFLPTLLRLLGRLEDPEDRRLLRALALLPALRRMAGLLEDSKDAWSRILCALPAELAEEGDTVERPGAPDAAATAPSLG